MVKKAKDRILSFYGLYWKNVILQNYNIHLCPELCDFYLRSIHSHVVYKANMDNYTMYILCHKSSNRDLFVVFKLQNLIALLRLEFMVFVWLIWLFFLFKQISLKYLWYLRS
jgi:hypothetical protein